MSFMDQKEEVIDIELTQYGKYLLSKGKFRPVYYSFFDDDVLYDTLYARFEEDQNDSENRIKTVPQMTAQYLFHGAETEINKINEIVRSGMINVGAEKIQPTPEKAFAMSAPLGTSNLDSIAAPSFRIKYLEGTLSGSVAFISSSYQTLKIPQLSSAVVFETEIGKKRENVPSVSQQGMQEQTLQEDENTFIFEDGTFIQVRKDSIILQIEEENTPFQNENFDIEVFLCETEKDNKIPEGEKQVLTPLSFVKRKSNINSSLILNEQELEENFPELDSSYVEYFLDINVDSEIDIDALCEVKGEEKIQNIFADTPFECDDEKVVEQEDIFIETPEDFEDCE